MSIFPDHDYYGGLALYSHDRLIGRIYYITLDNKSFFSAVPDGVSPEEFERQVWSVNDNDGQVALIDNLTGTRFPNDRYTLRTLYMRGNFEMCPFIWYPKRSNPFEGKTIADRIKTVAMLFLMFLIKLPYRIIRAMVYCFRLIHYTRWAKEQLYQKVESHLASQKTAVIDLRRGLYTVYQDDGPSKHFASTDILQHGRPAPFIPLKREFLTHIESFILALPAQNQSEFYLELRSWIDPEKVVELVIFDAINLDDFLMYKNIRKLSLPNADDLQSLEGLASFEQLEHVFISSVKDKTDVFDAAGIPDKVTVDCILGHYGIKDRHKRWQNGSWSSSPSMFWRPENDAADRKSD